MQWKKWKILIGLLLGLSLVVTLARPVHRLARPVRPIGGGLNLVVELRPQGQVKLKRSTWPDYQPAFIGASLAATDQLLLASNTFAKVLCQNLMPWEPEGGRDYIVSEGCPPTSTPKLLESDEDTVIERATNNPDIPYILRPRDSFVLNQQPLLRWHDVEGANTYQVRVIGPGVKWTQETSATEIVYSGKQSLQPEARYWLIVKTDQGKSSKQEGSFGFTILDQEKAQEVWAAAEEIKQKQLSKPAEALALAHLYRSNDLNAEAIDLLETALADGPESIRVYQLLGEIYQHVGLNRLARERYRQALELAKAAGDLDTQAQVIGGLAVTSAIIGQKDEAIAWLEKGKEVYQTLGDQVKAGQLEQQMVKILGG
ncbi:tetratricopeptide repeat protein [Moorena producens JHB]|uniref:Tetratricopeptide repeat protein n=1 Tax=Moorena producens (strain JHB) TaxID=1454205 RepID=A0A1D9G9X7_MOOP1|nr:tetratricopeptide repeat protein [Moorena producens]AOY84427.1 tetratricopeptide repeat protein [Moorena producens JHB]